MRWWFIPSLLFYLIICAECQEPGDNPTTTRKSTENELFLSEESITTTTIPADINTTLSSTEIENNSMTSDDTNIVNEITTKSAEEDESNTRDDNLIANDDEVDVTTRVEEKNDDDQEEEGFLSTLKEDEYDETTLPTTENKYLLSINDVFQKNIDVVKDDLRGIGIIREWLEEEAMGGSEVTTETEYQYTDVTDDYTDVNETDDYTEANELEENEEQEKENSAKEEDENGVDSRDKTIIETLEANKETIDNKLESSQDNEGIQVTVKNENEASLVEKIEDDLKLLNKLDTDEEKVVLERDEVIQDIDEKLKELEESSTKVKETTTVEVFVTENDKEIDIVTENSNIVFENDKSDEDLIDSTTLDYSNDKNNNEDGNEQITQNTNNPQENFESNTELPEIQEEDIKTTMMPITESILKEEIEENSEENQQIEIHQGNQFNEEEKTESNINMFVTESGLVYEDNKEEYTQEHIIVTTETINLSQEKEHKIETITSTIIPNQNNEDEEKQMNTEIKISHELILPPKITTTTEKLEEDNNNQIAPITTETINSATTNIVDISTVVDEKATEVTKITKVETDYTMVIFPDSSEEKELKQQITTESTIVKKIELAGEEILEDILEGIKEIEEDITPTTTENSLNHLLEETLNITKTVKTINNLLKEEDSMSAINSNTLHGSSEFNSSEDILIVNDIKHSLNNQPSKLPESETIDKGLETIKSLEEELTSDEIDQEHEKLFDYNTDITEEEDREDNILGEVDQFSNEKEDVTKEVVSKPKVYALVVDNKSGNVCLNASGLQIKITTNDHAIWVPDNAKTFGECTDSGAILNFTWKLLNENTHEGGKNATMSFTFNGDYQECYIEEILFKSLEGNFVASHLEKYLTEPTIINITKDTKVTITHPNIQLYNQKQDYATTMLSVDNALALQIASGGLCIFVVIIGVGIYAYRRLRSQARIFKVSLDK